jgi:hypothetical protein
MAVRVHYNLQRCRGSAPTPGERCWVTRDARRVTGYHRTLTLRAAQFIVQPGGLRRVRKQGQRAVIAYIKGAPGRCPARGTWQRVRFDPFTHQAFQVDGRPIQQAQCVRFRGRVAEALV